MMHLQKLAKHKRSNSVTPMDFQIPEHLVICYPINMKPLPKSLEEVNITNNTTGTGVIIKLIDDVFTESKYISKQLGGFLRNPHYANALQWSTDRMFSHLPFNTARSLIHDAYKAYDITMSNVPGPKVNLIYAGSKVEDLIAIFTTGFTHVFLMVMSYGGSFKFNLTYDSSLGLDPNVFMSFIHDEMENIIRKVE